MVLSCNNISKSYGAKDILKKINFHIEAKEKIAIVGINGAGKSTLLKIVVGEEDADEGSVTIGKDLTIGYLAQYQEFSDDTTIYEQMKAAASEVLKLSEEINALEKNLKNLEGKELEEALLIYDRKRHMFEQKDGYATDSRITGILKGLGFTEEDFSKKLSSLSGGQKTRVSLGRLLLERPDIILLDEPTNHLDLKSIAWLESYLSGYDGAVILVSHDRYFLDNIVTKVVEIESGKSEIYHGNYSYYAEKCEEVRMSRYRAYMNNQAEIAHQEAVIAKLKQFNREKSIKRAESREKLLAKMERVERPRQVNDEMRLSLVPSVESGNDVLLCKNLSKSYGDKRLFDDVEIDIKKGECVALIGGNGTGKTTILKIINGIVPKDKGEVHLGAQVHVGYYDQEQQNLNPDKTIFDELHDSYPDMTNTRIRNVLAAFLFTGDDVFKEIKDISGGERGRVSLARLMLSGDNFLILDEPTNHLDIASKEILENALQSFDGTVFYVSHDRYFINRTATRILELEEGKITSYTGNYDDYLERKEVMKVSETETETVDKNETEAKLDWKKAKENQAKERKRQNDIKKTEEEISLLEEKIAAIDDEMQKPEVAVNSAKLNELVKERTDLSDKLDEAYARWEELESY